MTSPTSSRSPLHPPTSAVWSGHVPDLWERARQGSELLWNQTKDPGTTETSSQKTCTRESKKLRRKLKKRTRSRRKKTSKRWKNKCIGYWKNLQYIKWKSKSTRPWLLLRTQLLRNVRSATWGSRLALLTRLTLIWRSMCSTTLRTCTMSTGSIKKHSTRTPLFWRTSSTPRHRGCALTWATFSSSRKSTIKPSKCTTWH